MASKTIIEEFVAVLGWEVDSDELKEFDKAVSDLGHDLKWVTGLIAGATAALGAVVVTTNQGTAEMANLAESVGITAETFEALAGIVKNVGFESDRVIDLVEEMNNKLGEKKGLGKMTAVEESLKILNLEFKELIKLNPEQQFQSIIDAALKLEDVQLSVSAVDMLMGGEANKILGFLRSTGSSLEVILERYKALNLLSEEGREGAKQFNMLWGQFTGVLESALGLFSGLVGQAMTPMLNEFLDFVAANRELIQINVKRWAEDVAKWMRSAWLIIRRIVKPIQKLVKDLGGLKNVVKLLGIAFAAFKTAKIVAALSALNVALGAGSITDGLSVMANPVVLLTVLLIILGLAIEDLIVYFEGGDSLLGKWGETIAEFVDVHLTNLMAALFDLTEEEFKLALVDRIDELVVLFSETLPNAINDFVYDVGVFFDKMADDNLEFSEKAEIIWAGLEGFIKSWFETIGELWGALFLKLDEKFPSLTDTILEFAADVENFFTGVADTIIETFDKAVGAVGSLIDKGRGFLQGLPVVGSLFEGGGDAPNPGASPSVGGTGLTDAFAGLGLSPSQTQSTLAPSQSVVNQTSNQTSSQAKTEVHNEINVTQLPGENSQDLARRITDTMQVQVAAAVRNNETGVVY